MSDIRTPIIRVIKSNLGQNSVNENTKLELVEVYFNDKNKSISIIEHFQIKVGGSSDIFSNMLPDLNNLFDEIAMPRKCVGVYFEGDYLNVLIRG